MFTPGSVVVVASVDEVEDEVGDELLVDCETEEPVVCPESGGVEDPPRENNTPAVIPAITTAKQRTNTARRRVRARLSPELMYVVRRSCSIERM
jgi:hypothetical protein